MMGYPRQMVRVESDYFTASSANLQPAETEQFPAFTNQEEETSGSRLQEVQVEAKKEEAAVAGKGRLSKTNSLPWEEARPSDCSVTEQ